MAINQKLVANAMGKAVLQTVRGALYVALLVVGRVLIPVVNLALFAGLVIFLFCGVFRPDLSTPMLAGAGIAIGSVVVTTLYEATLRLLAPADAVIFTDI